MGFLKNKGLELAYSSKWIHVSDCYIDPLGWKDKTRKYGNVNVASKRIALDSTSYKSVKDMDKFFLAIIDLGRVSCRPSKQLCNHDQILSIFGFVHSNLHEEKTEVTLEYMSFMVASVEPNHHSLETSLLEKNFTQRKFNVGLNAEDGITVGGLLPMVQFNLQLSEKQKIDKARESGRHTSKVIEEEKKGTKRIRPLIAFHLLSPTISLPITPSYASIINLPLSLSQLLNNDNTTTLSPFLPSP
ncbi:unnamed protein product [Vicia faba]|uniref:Elongator complex protein 5 n=1 Tax=Vicia faba TaxID=3906 RepID=A0AAV1B6V0_VICFA|nr:unnamed protein product [Vicia faba]